MAKKVSVTAYPYATIFGEIKVPDEVKDEDIRKYIDEHFDDITFGEPDLDYCGTDYEFCLDD